MNRLFALMVAASLAGPTFADEGTRPTAVENEGGMPLMVSSEDLKWTELPERKGMQFAVLSGDPNQGTYTQMRKVPAGTDNPLHTHSSELKNVIISGVWYTGASSASAEDFGPGSIIVMPANWVHVSGCRAGSDCMFYQEGKGKFDFHPATDSNPGQNATVSLGEGWLNVALAGSHGWSGKTSDGHGVSILTKDGAVISVVFDLEGALGKGCTSGRVATSFAGAPAKIMTSTGEGNLAGPPAFTFAGTVNSICGVRNITVTGYLSSPSMLNGFVGMKPPPNPDEAFEANILKWHAEKEH